MKAHLVRWRQELGEKGLVVLEIDNGAVDALEAVRRDYERKSLNFPVLWDSEGRNFQAYGIKALPRSVLIGADGKVVWEGNPSGKEVECERRIRGELMKVKP
jgi:peroxiredoxin